MAEFGVTLEGFVAKDLEIVLEELETEQRSEISPGINTQADSLLGQLNGVFADKITELWEVALAVYRSRQADSAAGEGLDNVGALTNALRLAAASSEATLSLNLDPATALPIATLVSIGASGEQWETLTAVTNPNADQENFEVVVKSSNTGPIVGNAYAIDTIVSPIAGWTAKAAVTSLNSEPYELADLQTLLVQVDEGATQTVVFNTADFADITAATAQEIVDAIVADTTGIDGLDVAGFVRLFSELDGTGSAIKLLGGTGFEALGISQELIKGFNPSRSAKIINANNETYDMSGSPTLFVSIDQGASQLITFVDADFGVAATGTLTAIVASLLAPAVDTDTFTLDDGVNPAVVFVFDDDASVVETAVLRAIAHNGTQNENQIRDLMITAINAAPTLDITATPAADNTVVNLENDTTGVAGNVAITETVADAGFLFTGMAGGVANAPAVATAIQVAKKINEVIVGGVAYEVGGKVQVESLVVGPNSEVEIPGGTSNVELGFTLSDAQGGTSGDAELGRVVENDADFRLRRLNLLRVAGSATTEAIRSALINTEGVTQAFVFENDTNVVDSFGRPPKSIEAVVSGGTDEDIALSIFKSKAAGIQAWPVAGPNGVTIVVLDSQGSPHTIGFTRAGDIDMHVEVDISVLAAEFGAGNQASGEQEVREAIKALGDVLDIGEDVFILPFRCAPLAVFGVKDVTAIFIEDVDPPLNAANIVIAPRDEARFSTANIDINVTFI